MPATYYGLDSEISHFKWEILKQLVTHKQAYPFP